MKTAGDRCLRPCVKSDEKEISINFHFSKYSSGLSAAQVGIQAGEGVGYRPRNLHASAVQAKET